MNESATDGAASSYREWEPPPRWRRVVVCLWEQQVTGGQYVQRVLPDGCADIIADGDGHAVVAGPAHHATLPELHPGTVRGVRLRSEAIGPVLGLPASELTDNTIPLDAVVPARQARAAVAMLMGAGGPDDTGDSSFWGCWADAVIDPRLRAACTALRRATTGTVEGTAEEVGLSARQLRRLLLDATGQGPKALQRVGRLQRFLDLAERPSRWTASEPAGSEPAGLAWVGGLAGLAAVSGYADQAHLCREVRDMSGTTPVDLLRERRHKALGSSATSL